MSKAEGKSPASAKHPAIGFHPPPVQKLASPADPPSAEATSADVGDARDGRIYVYHDPQIALGVRVAASTGRPLLISGPSGCGKSTLARNVAGSLDLRYYEFVVTGRSEGRDLLWRFDHVERLNDAAEQNTKVQSRAKYLMPGVLWWAINQRSAATVRLGKDIADAKTLPDVAVGGGPNTAAVVLIDEIDKADINLPNDLLVPLGSLQFRVEPLDDELIAHDPKHHPPPLIIITTNGERELPPAFVRRCVTLDLKPPDDKQLVNIAKAVFDDASKSDLFEQVAAYFVKQQKVAQQEDLLPPSTAEYLDTLRACLDFGITYAKDGAANKAFESLTALTLRKKRGVGPAFTVEA